MSRAQGVKSNLILKAQARSEGYAKIIGRGDMALKHLEFGLLRISSGEWLGESECCEQVLDVHSGIVSVNITLPDRNVTCDRVGHRDDVFDGAPSMIYVPPGASCRIRAEHPAEIAFFSARNTAHNGSPVIMKPKNPGGGSVLHGGEGTGECVAIGENIPAARLMVDETVTVPGGWMGYPHKHDAFNPPDEVALEEICYFRMSPSQGYGLMRIYTQPNDPSPLNEVYVVEDGDAVVIPRGYHSVAAAPGCMLHCTRAQAGDIRKSAAWTFDPRHARPSDT